MSRDRADCESEDKVNEDVLLGASGRVEEDRHGGPMDIISYLLPLLNIIVLSRNDLKNSYNSRDSDFHT